MTEGSAGGSALGSAMSQPPASSSASLLTSSPKLRRSGGQRVAAATAGVVLALVLLEVAFRVAGLGALPATKCHLQRDGDLDADYHCYPSNPSGEFVPVPDVSQGVWHLQRLASPVETLDVARISETPWCVEYRRAGAGVRGPALSQFRPRDTVRIAGMGDSFALGEGVPYEKSLFVHLARLLGPGVEVPNGAESGLDTRVEIRKLEWMARTYDCSRGLIVFTLNDVQVTPEQRRSLDGAYDLINLRTSQLGGGARPWWRRVSRVAEFLAGAAEVREITRTTIQCYLDTFDPAKNPDGLTELGAQFRMLARWRECRVGIVVYPMMIGSGAGYPLQACHDQVVRLARQEGLPVLDLAPTFDGEDRTALRVHEVDHHPNGRAHEIAARAIADWIRHEPSLKW
ncbi:MAG: hypothetical protein K8T90_04410 [Planctomycetes bacterium]|nr:hypothetical protein [Planctomycetota bacterium]